MAAMVFSLLLVPKVQVAEAAGKYSGRVINVVYDDSGSMVTTNHVPILRWSQAKYSLEVFAAMLSETDTMNIYPMSQSGGLGYTFTGKNKDRVSTVHNMNGRYLGTPFETVESAGRALMNEPKNMERWLVIITDGEFARSGSSVVPLDEVERTIETYLKDGIKVAYLGIGDDASVLSGNPGMGFFTEKASDGVDVLKKVTNIANQIFSHLVLPSEYITNSGGKYSLSFDIPTSQIIVFAQGDNVSIGDLSKDGNTIKPTELENVKYSDVIPENYSDAIVDDTLKGVVATFDSGSQPFSDGSFDISISGATTAEFYYKPGVVVNADLIYEGSPVLQDAELYEGEYDVQMNFMNPLTGMPVDSKLLADAAFSLDIKNNEDLQQMEATKGTIRLVEGSVELTATAELPGQVVLTDIKNYTVLPKPITLKIDTEKEKESFTKQEITDGNASVKVTVTNESGSKLSEEEWNNTNIKTDEHGNVVWDIKKGDEVSTWILTSKASDASKTIFPGKMDFVVSADYKIGGQYAHGTGSFSIEVLQYMDVEMGLEVISTPSYTLYNLEQEPGVVVRAYTENTETHEKQTIDEELWNNMALTVATDSKLDLTWEKGQNVGEYIIHPFYYETEKSGFFGWLPKSHERKAFKTDSGNVVIRVEGETFGGDKKYHGSTQADITIQPLGVMEKLLLMLPILIILAVLLFLIIGYLVKHKIPKRKLRPAVIYHGKPAKKKIRKLPMTVLLPYVSEKGVAYCHDSAHKCEVPNLLIKAGPKGTFKILNQRLPLDKMTINFASYTDMREIKSKMFSYASFEATSLDQYKKPQGSFKFKA